MLKGKININWPQLIVQVISLTIVVVGVILGFAESKGDQRWANKAKTENAIRTLEQSHIRNDEADKGHHENIDLHMRFAEKREIFVTRTEWEDWKEVEEGHFEKIERQQEAFWQEQRAVNREILQRLPKP